jgi:glucose/mannose-6-phosphate isomerase
LATEDTEAQLKQAADFLEQGIKAWLPTVPTAQNLAKQIALECIGKSIVIYGGPLLFPVAYKWKISFNENAKHVAWCNQYSEFNHNEFLGWTKQPVDKPYTVIDLRSSLEHPQIQKRFVVSAKLLSGVRPDPIVVTPEGETILEQLVWTIALGDFVTLYTALLNNINPTPVDLIEKLKKELA